MNKRPYERKGENMEFPEAVLYVIAQIMQAGGQAYLVGGALRDYLLGRAVTDYDIAASLSPEMVEDVFQHEKTYPSGKRFGTITVAAGGLNIEVTTFRTESGYSDSRHPDQVTFVPDIVSDLSRRDFTINAMAYNPFVDSGLIDPFLGREDLKRGVIRTVGLPQRRFEEDPLRMLRGIRFAAQLDFYLEEETKKAITECKPLLKHVSRERVRDELEKLLLSPHPDKGILLLQAADILAALLTAEPEPAAAASAEAIQDQTLFETAVLTEKEAQIIKKLPAELDYRLAALLYMMFSAYTPASAPQQDRTTEFSRMLQNLRLDKKCINHVIRLVKGYSCFCSMVITPYHMRKLLGEFGLPDTRHLLHWYKITQSVNGSTDVDNKCIAAIRQLDAILEQGDPVFQTDLAINGNDILEAGIGRNDGRLVGEALNLAYEWLLQDPDRNQAGILIEGLKKYYGKKTP
jgi:tRNA nucleotidyltransferase (CCA-adding enzyme)